MGCDIHGVVQRCEGGKWITYREGYDERNYEAFAHLAGVRNGYNVTPIASPRGWPKGFTVRQGSHRLPDDFRWRAGSHREKYARETNFGNPRDFAAYWMGDHSFSWVSLRELVEREWSKPHTDSGLIDEKTFLAWRSETPRKMPPSWCGGVGGPNIIVVDEADFEKAAAKRRPGDKFYIRASWTVPTSDAVGKGFLDFIDSMMRDARELGVEFDHIRFVFGFDS